MGGRRREGKNGWKEKRRGEWMEGEAKGRMDGRRGEGENGWKEKGRGECERQTPRTSWEVLGDFMSRSREPHIVAVDAISNRNVQLPRRVVFRFIAVKGHILIQAK